MLVGVILNAGYYVWVRDDVPIWRLMLRQHNVGITSTKVESTLMSATWKPTSFHNNETAQPSMRTFSVQPSERLAVLVLGIISSCQKNTAPNMPTKEKFYKK